MFKFWSSLKFGSKLRSINRKLSTNDSNNLYPIRKIDLRICGQLYKELKLKHKLYRNSPNDGLSVNIEYADTYCEDRNNSKPVIVGLHGVPGSHEDFSQLIKYFDSKNCRVIVPNFPGYELTRETQSYWHSAEERAQLVRDLLTAIGVKEVDALVCHSGGLSPGSFLWSETEKLVVKSVALLNVPSDTFVAKWRIIFTKFFATLITHNIHRFSVNPQLIAKLLGYPSYGDSDQLLEGALMSAYCRFETVDQRLKYLRDNRIPTLFLMSENDNLIDKKYFFDAIKNLGGDKNASFNYDIFDGNKTDVKLVSNLVNNESNLQVINIRPAGHFAFIKFSDIVNPYIEKLIKSIRS